MTFDFIPATDKFIGRKNPIVHEVCITKVAQQFFLAFATKGILDVHDITTGIRQTDEGFSFLFRKMEFGTVSYNTSANILTR